MSVQIRKHSIISSVVIYFGFLIGALNNFFFTKDGFFTGTEYGLTSGFFVPAATFMMSFACLGMPSYIYKFYPYYNDRLPPKKNDMLTISLIAGAIGFLMVLAIGIGFKWLFEQKFSSESPMAVDFYYWMFPFGFGLTIFSILEAYTWNLRKSILTNFLREVLFRLVTTALICLFIFKIIPSFASFIKLYSFGYIFIALVLLIYLIIKKKIFLTFKISSVTKKFSKNILRFLLFVYPGSLILNLSMVFDSFVISSVSKQGLQGLAIYTFAQYLTSLIQAPQRGIQASATPFIAQAWKDKNIRQIQSIYQRSSINMLIFACLLFVLVWANFSEAIKTLGLQAELISGVNVFLLLGITKIIDLGTGVNASIIGTSKYWKFELTSGIILLLLMLPLNYYLAKKMDIFGPALANLISVMIYNGVRILFLWRKFRLFPFTIRSLYTIILSATVYIISWLLFRNLHGFAGLFARSIFILAAVIGGVYWLKLTPDLQPVLESLRKRIKRR
ncbi:lipopolysaccharide biosynthesis protein [Niabella beijingensis]|uniref:lipopolysaccharide biosynthesis protein n=1 Tax=Niabella beijingensis TaxID=2872700 RepID=UPI001CBF77D9|nr:MATE family efflux transporter [Niabella beijingensis]MBZ4190827.1 lipopolysaccharide biosynthesis protein [Niabella beijingensis]